MFPQTAWCDSGRTTKRTAGIVHHLLRGLALSGRRQCTRRLSCWNVRALHDAELKISRVCGASIGAIVGAIIVGNQAADRVERIEAFWSIAVDKLTFPNSALAPKIMGVLRTLTTGRPGLFFTSVPWTRRALGLSSPSLFDRNELGATLESLVDFKLLNSGEIRFFANCVDVETGEEHAFDTQTDCVSVEHLLASSAFPGLYNPVRIGDRYMVAGSLAANLPVRALFRDFPDTPVICVALDLFKPGGNVPSCLDDALHRAEDLLFRLQSKRTLRGLRREFTHLTNPIMLYHMAYSGAGEIGGKMLDDSEHSMKNRHLAGMQDGATLTGYITSSPQSAKGAHYLGPAIAPFVDNAKLGLEFGKPRDHGPLVDGLLE